MYTVFLRRILRRAASQNPSHGHLTSSPSRTTSTSPPLRIPSVSYALSPEETAAMRAIEHDPLKTCQICNEPHLMPRPDGTIEVPSILPCGHVFGSLCISRWLEVSSLNKDCPHCRRAMQYKGCGCGVKALPLELAPGLLSLNLELEKPEPVKEDEMPDKCWVCRCVERAYEGKGGEMGEKLRMMRERMRAEEQALEGLKILGSPSLFGGPAGVGSVGRDFVVRAAETRNYWRGEMERLSAEIMTERRAW